MATVTTEIFCQQPAWSEAERLRALDAYAILDTPLEPLFDELVQLAADVCDAPIAVINFIADGRQWFKAEVGIGARELPLDVSICRFAILQPGLFVVPDLTQDPRFENNPLVTQAGGLRFYAGSLLETPDGLPLGTLCILDTKPREGGLAERQGRALASLARHVMSELELRKAIAQRNADLEEKRASVAALEALIVTRKQAEEAGGDFSRVLRVIAKGVLAAMPEATAATVELVEGDDLVYRAAAGVTEAHLGLRVNRGGSLAGRSVLEGRPLVSADSELDDRVDRDSCRLVGARSFVVVPLIRHGDAVGVLKLQAARPDVFGPREITIAQLFAGILAASFADAAETKALRALRASEAELRERLNAIPQMVWSTTADGTVDFYSHSWHHFTGAPLGTTEGEGWSDMLHPDDRDRVWAEWRRVLASGEPYEVEYRLRYRDEGYRWVLGRALPIRDEQGAIRRWMGTSTDIDDLKRTSEELGRTSALLRLIGDSSPDLIFAKDRESRLLYANPAAQRVIGAPISQVLGKADDEWATDKAQAEKVMATDQQVVSTGETVDVDEVITDAAGQTLYFRSVKAPLRTPAGEIIGLVGITSDITKRRATEERERLLAREIDHRSKNLLAVVQSVVQLTRADDADGLKNAVMGRIQSLARAHSLLAAGRWEGVDLRQLVTEELAAYAGRELGRITIEGPTLHLRPTAAQALGLVIHELATNAVKYGALSALAGRLAIDWSLSHGPDEDQRLGLRWVERGADKVAPPTRKGFGTTVIRSSVERQLGGKILLDWLGDGLACEISIPAAQIVAGQSGEQVAAAVPARASAPCVMRDLGGLRVLIVEDEALVGLQVEQVLRDAGCLPIGPAATILEAIDYVLTGEVDAALLDVNLAGGRSYAVADMLAAKGVPFAFCTGYSGPTDLPERFADSRVLTKPLRAEQILESLPSLLGEG